MSITHSVIMAEAAPLALATVLADHGCVFSSLEKGEKYIVARFDFIW
jgi:hypothetical protein